MIPKFQPPFFVSGKLDFEFSYHAIFSEKFEGERFVNKCKKGNKIIVERNNQKETKDMVRKGSCCVGICNNIDATQKNWR